MINIEFMKILDASVLIRLLKLEPGHKAISSLFTEAENHGESVFMCQTNYMEVVYSLLKRFDEKKTKAALARIKSPFLAISNYMDTDLALYSAKLKASYDLSFGDATGLAFTKIMKGTFYTADKALVVVAKKEGIRLVVVG